MVYQNDLENAPIKTSVGLGKMDLVKRILIITLCLFFLSSTALVGLCSEIKISSTQACQSSSINEPDQSHDEHSDRGGSPCNNKTPCPTKYSCCTLAIQGQPPYLSVLDLYPSDFAENPFQPLEIAKSFYHPPRI